MTRAIIIVAVLSGSFALAQSIPKKYFELAEKADSLYRARDFKNATLFYSAAFESNHWLGLIEHRYNAACAWALSNVPDSAFFQLYRIANKARYKEYDKVVSDPDLISLHSDSRWQPLIDVIRQNKETAEKNLNKPLAAKLDSIFIEDQKYRLELEAIEKKYGRQSKEVSDHWAVISEKDSINLVQVKGILNQYGWLGADVIGERGNAALFLVIQHADLTTQVEYLPMMREAVKKGNASGSSLALLEDRIALGQGRKQIYGSQIGYDPETGVHFVLPLDDPDNVDKRRAEVGLQPLAEYVSHWEIKWDLEQYKRELPELERKWKQN